MARYYASGENTLAAAADSAVSLTSNTATVQRNWVYEITLGNVGAPADLVSVYLIGKVTASGDTATAVTPTLLDEADRAAQARVLSNHSTEPTYQNTGTVLTTPAQGDLLRVPLNHRATYRWVAPPGGEFVCPAVSGDGIAGKTDHASATTDYMVGCHWYE